MKQLDTEKLETLKDYDDVLTFKEYQKVLKIGRNKAYQLLQDKKIMSIKIGTNYRIPKKAIIDYLYQNC